MAATITNTGCTSSYRQVKHALNGGQRQVIRKFYSSGMLSYMHVVGFDPDNRDKR